jgi:Tol biopolymer transport system component
MQPLLNSAAAEYSPAFSPDGRWLAYVSDESGRPEVNIHGYRFFPKTELATNERE